MCTYLLRHTSGMYYFRMGIPAAVRPMLGGRRDAEHREQSPRPASTPSAVASVKAPKRDARNAATGRDGI